MLSQLRNLSASLLLFALPIQPAASQNDPTPTATLYVTHGSGATTITTLSITKVGVLPRWTPPADCDSATLDRTSTVTGSNYVRVNQYYEFGCGVGDRATCCPPNWAKDGFYDPGAVPSGYIMTYDKSMSIEMGARTAWFACPTLANPSLQDLTLDGVHYLWRFSYGVSTTTSSMITSPWCMYKHEETTISTRSSTASGSSGRITYTSMTWALAHPIFLFTTNGPIPDPTTTDPGDTTTTPPGPEPTDPPDEPEGKAGLSSGAIAGIAVGVALPVLALVGFLAFKFGRKGKETGQPLESVPMAPPPPAWAQGGGQYGPGNEAFGPGKPWMAPPATPPPVDPRYDMIGGIQDANYYDRR